MMDNIQKLIVGVLGISGLLAMLTPSSVPFADKSGAVASAVDAPVLPQNADGENAPGEFAEAELIDDGDDFAIGEPAIDGNPIGVANTPSETPVPDYGQVVDYQTSDYGAANYAPQAFSPQQNSALPPPPGTLMPVNNGQ